MIESFECESVGGGVVGVDDLYDFDFGWMWECYGVFVGWDFDDCGVDCVFG